MEDSQLSEGEPRDSALEFCVEATPMIAEVTAGIQSLKAAADLVKALKAAATQAEVNELKIELQGRILEAQSALMSAQEVQSNAIDRIRTLEQQIAGFENWEREKERYEIKALGAGAFVYVRKSGAESGEPEYWLCVNCFENRKKSILQKRPGSLAQMHLQIPTTYECAACNAKVVP